MSKVFKDKYLISILISLILVVISRNQFVKSYHKGVGKNLDKSIEVVGKLSGEFFFADNSKVVVGNEEEHHDHSECGKDCSLHKHNNEEEKDYGTDLDCGEPGHVHNCKHHHHHHHHEKNGEESSVSPGLAVFLRQMGFGEMAASLLWIQMDADSHKGLWHRVDFALDLIPALDPTFVEAYTLRASILARDRKQPEKAIELLISGIKKIPNRTELWDNLGLISFNFLGHYGERRNLDIAEYAYYNLSIFSDAPAYAARNLARVYAAKGDYEKAEKFVRHLITLPERVKYRKDDMLCLQQMLDRKKF